jgi:23S rRNA (adenine2503-C2)-methyltransferase
MSLAVNLISITRLMASFNKPLKKQRMPYIKALEANSIVVKVRRSRGKDIDAACGQLANKEA